MLRLAHLKARIERLNKLAMAFSLERLDIRKGNDPLYFAEREAYMRGLDQAIHGLEAARKALALACIRIEREG
jgi:hypothetical protein